MQTGLLNEQQCLQIFGRTAINVSQLFDELRKCGDLVPIGAETGVVEEQCRR